MKILILFLALISLQPLMAQSVADLDAKYGFRDIPLGAPKASLNIAVANPKNANGTQTVYLKRSDLTLNGLPLTSISCDLFEDRVYQITVFGSVANRGRQPVTGYMKFIRDLFGRPDSVISKGGAVTVSEWNGARVRLEAVEKNIETSQGAAYQIEIKIISKDEAAFARENKAKNVKDGF